MNTCVCVHMYVHVCMQVCMCTHTLGLLIYGMYGGKRIGGKLEIFENIIGALSSDF